jgi:hypothetical protein
MDQEALQGALPHAWRQHTESDLMQAIATVKNNRPELAGLSNIQVAAVASRAVVEDAARAAGVITASTDRPPRPRRRKAKARKDSHAGGGRDLLPVVDMIALDARHRTARAGRKERLQPLITPPAVHSRVFCRLAQQGHINDTLLQDALPLLLEHGSALQAAASSQPTSDQG